MSLVQNLSSFLPYLRKMLRALPSIGEAIDFSWFQNLQSWSYCLRKKMTYYVTIPLSIEWVIQVILPA